MNFKKKTVILCLLTLFIVMIICSVTIFSVNNYVISIALEKVKGGDFHYLYKRYISKAPSINGKPSFGDPNAPIIIIAFLDFKSDASRQFITSVFPTLNEEYISTGKLKFIHKPYITTADYLAKGETFKYSQSLACVKLLKPEVYYDFYFDLFKTKAANDTTRLAIKYNVPKNQFRKCMESQEFDETHEDMLDVELLGMRGIYPRFYIGLSSRDNMIINGVAKYSKFRDIIRNYQVTIGD